jgi:phosphate transport system protein
MLEERINALKRNIIEYATVVENMIDKSIRGLSERNEALLKEVIEQDEPRVNQYDNAIAEDCLVVIARHEPVARDLRMVLMILKMNSDLERMGDHAVNICESALFLISRPALAPSKNIPPMAAQTTTMLRESIDSFVNEDAALAQKVRMSDNGVDELNEEIIKTATTFMREEHDGIKRSLNLIRIAHNLERIADLSTNIAEEVIFIVQGKDIKHHKDGGNGI